MRSKRLAWPEAATIGGAALLLPAVAIVLRLRGLGPSLTLLGRLVPTRRVKEDSSRLSDAAAIARLVRIAAAYGPYRANCLPRSVVLWILLRRHGLDPEIRIGAEKRHRGFVGHAWVEVDGQSLETEPDGERVYAPFQREASTADGRTWI